MSAPSNAESANAPKDIPIPPPATAEPPAAVVATTLPSLKKIDAKSLDLQQNINNFSLYYGDIAEPPSMQEQK
jgi:hypothetical protein